MIISNQRSLSPRHRAYLAPAPLHDPRHCIDKKGGETFILQLFTED